MSRKRRIDGRYYSGLRYGWRETACSVASGVASNERGLDPRRGFDETCERMVRERGARLEEALEDLRTPSAQGTRPTREDGWFELFDLDKPFAGPPPTDREAPARASHSPVSSRAPDFAGGRSPLAGTRVPVRDLIEHSPSAACEAERWIRTLAEMFARSRAAARYVART